MLKHDNKIIHLGNTSLYDYLKNLKTPIALYGMGEEGQIIYSALKYHNIKILAIADGSPAKQGSCMDELTVLSMQELAETMPKQTHVWVSIADETISKPVIEFFANQGFENILNIMLKDVSGLCHFSNFQSDLDCVIVGVNDLAFKVHTHLKENNVKTVGFFDPSTNLKEYNGVKICDLDYLFSSNSNKNVIICNDKLYKSVLTSLRKYYVLGNVYRGISGADGEFEIQKYQIENMFIRQTLTNLLSHVNVIYSFLNDEKSKQIFKNVIAKSLNNYKKNKSFKTIKLEYSNYTEFLDILSNKYYPQKHMFINIENNLLGLIDFLAALKYYFVLNKEIYLEYDILTCKVSIILQESDIGTIN